MTLNLIVDRSACGSADLPKDDALQQWVEAVLSTADEEPLIDHELSIVFQSIDKMREINHEYRSSERPTNVLSFPSAMPVLPVEQGRALRALGDIVMCPEVVDQEAQAQTKQAMHHYCHLVIHGVLHVLGYDHESELEAKTMESLEIQILSGLGISNPYVESTKEASDLQQ